MNLPAGCGDMSDEVVLLQRTVYELRETGIQWNLRLSGVLLQKTVIIKSKVGPCVFRKVVRGDITLFYVFDAFYVNLMISWYKRPLLIRWLSVSIYNMSRRLQRL